MSTSLSARHVVHRFGSVLALDDVSVEVPPGRAVALVGESGSGKTTLLRCFNAMVVPQAGAVSVDGADVRDLDAIKLRRRLGYVQQHGGLLPHWTVRDNVGLVLRAMSDGSNRADAQTVTDALALTGLDPARFGDRYPRELSGGQRQRVALARALAARPAALLLDEPFGALDAITRREVQDAFAGVRQELQLTMLIVTHDIVEAARLADELVVMRAGKVEQRGSLTELRRLPATDYVRALIARALAPLE